MQMQKSVYSHDLRETVATPKVGNFRPNADKTNPLLSTYHLGCVKPSTYDLPSKQDFQHEFGLRQERDGITSNDVLGAWAEHEGTGDQKAGRDFKALNKQAAMQGASPHRYSPAKLPATNMMRAIVLP